MATDFSLRLKEDWQVEQVFAGGMVEGIRLGGSRGPGWWRSLQFARQVNRLAGKVNPDVVLSLERGPRCDLYRAGDGVHRRWIEVKYGGSCRWVFNPLNWVYPSQERQTVRSARLVVANSEMVAAELSHAYPEERNKIRVIRNGYDPDRFHPEHSDDSMGLDVPPDSRLFLFLGSGWERKGLAVAIRFFAEVVREDPDFREKGRLIVAGEGDNRSYLAQAERLGLKDKVLFLGPASEPANLCRSAELMVLPTRYDPFSNATLEALACGCPVLTTQTNGAAEVIDPGRTGLLFEDSEERDPVTAAREFLGTTFAPREAIAESVASMTREAELARYEELLGEIVLTKEAASG